MTFDELQDFCQEYYPDEPTCAAQAMILFVVPIFPGGEPVEGKFRLIPEGIDPDVVVDAADLVIR